LALAHWIAGPVRRLAVAAKRVSAGGLKESVEPVLKETVLGTNPHGGDEIADLAQSFSSMLESLRRSQDELIKAERLAVTGKLAASVAHEIRNPLTSLRMTIQMLQQRAGNDKTTQEAYAIVLSEIDRLALAVEELLTFARPRPPQRAPTDLNKLVSDTLSFMERQLAHARVKAQTELDESLPKDFAVDSNKIRQVLVNLILNAQQAIVRDGTITVRTSWDAQKRIATIAVADTGPGVPEEIRTKLFELFVSTKPGGGGLGLAIAKQIAEEHGGAIRFESSPKGTTFFVTLS
jgi:signal transduction histidine kinase